MNDGSQSSSNPFSCDIDPDIAKLMGLDSPCGDSGKPQFSQLFDDEAPETLEAVSDLPDLTKKTFPKITKFDDTPKPYFSDKEYYRKALSGGGESSQRLHALLTQFLQAQDPKDKSLYREKIVSAYWNFMDEVAKRCGGDLPIPKRFLLRFGIVLPSLLAQEHLQLFSKIVYENETGEPFHYVDEWLEKVATGQITGSATDEVKPSQRSAGSKIAGLLDKAKGQRELQLSLLRKKIAELEDAENDLKSYVQAIVSHDVRSDFGMKDAYNPTQKKGLYDLQETAKRLTQMDKEIVKLYQELEDADKQYTALKAKAAEEGNGSAAKAIDAQAVLNEFNTVRQMIKMCVGRQGNHFPIALKQYLKPALGEYATRENVITAMAQVEALDPGLFNRTFKQQTTRIVPYVIIVPCYGDKGICWEPFERFNRATSRGRIAVPLYPKDLKVAVISALADLRWQVAKEKAQHYWMEEGLTGKYYQWYSERKLKGDVKEYFIQDYILWITKESEGTQKLDKDVRAVFWRYIPFPQELKDSLRNRGFAYSELYKRDQNRAASDGY
jgi:hypothetical protein